MVPQEKTHSLTIREKMGTRIRFYNGYAVLCCFFANPWLIAFDRLHFPTSMPALFYDPTAFCSAGSFAFSRWRDRAKIVPIMHKPPIHSNIPNDTCSQTTVVITADNGSAQASRLVSVGRI
jgi:hypothetical protein